MMDKQFSTLTTIPMSLLQVNFRSIEPILYEPVSFFAKRFMLHKLPMVAPRVTPYVLYLANSQPSPDQEKYGIQLTVEKLENASKSLNKLIDSQIVNNCKKGLGYNAVPPPHIGLFMPPKPDLSYIGLEEFTREHAVKTLNAKTSEEVPKVVKKDNGIPIIKDWKSDDEDESVPQLKIEKKTVIPSVAKVEFVKPKQQSQNARKTIKNVKKSRQSTNSKRGNKRN
uniref:Uncharacterized protein n=1 Tax=Tanacetum cinerariifolium TaxID=118510 RepID=A0A6L2NTL9_TANCI|nr:hypothetical protein [Tanacetum cinerariifolium]